MPTRTREQRVMEYVDSPLLFHRVKLGAEILCEVNGHEGVYLARASILARGPYACSCPSELEPCKHVEALRETFRRNPDSFFDAEATLYALADRPKPDLLETMRAIIRDTPGVLRTLDSNAFGDEDDGIRAPNEEE